MVKNRDFQLFPEFEDHFEKQKPLLQNFCISDKQADNLLNGPIQITASRGKSEYRVDQEVELSPDSKPHLRARITAVEPKGKSFKITLELKQ